MLKDQESGKSRSFISAGLLRRPPPSNPCNLVCTPTPCTLLAVRFCQRPRHERPASKSTERLYVARRLSRLLEKNWVHCRPRPGSAVLVGVAFRRRLTGSTVKRATSPPRLCILCQRACRKTQARISPKKKDDATTTPKQTGVHTLPYFLVDVLNGVPR